MGHGLLSKPLHCQRQLPSHADQQPGATYAKHGQPSVFPTVRVTAQSDRSPHAVCLPATVSDSPCRVQRTRLATKRGKCVRSTGLETKVELFC